MSVEVETVFRMWCDDCGKWLSDSIFPYIQQKDFQREDTLYHEPKSRAGPLTRTRPVGTAPTARKGNDHDP